jgi:hypothetical protein
MAANDLTLVNCKICVRGLLLFFLTCASLPLPLL